MNNLEKLRKLQKQKADYKFVSEDSKNYKQIINSNIFKKIKTYLYDKLEQNYYDFIDDNNVNVIQSKFKEYNPDWCAEELDDDIEAEIFACLEDMSEQIAQHLLYNYKK